MAISLVGSEYDKELSRYHKSMSMRRILPLMLLWYEWSKVAFVKAIAFRIWMWFLKFRLNGITHYVFM